MNLMFLDSIEKETFGGMEEWIRLVSKGLVARGHRVTVVGRPESELLRRVRLVGTSISTLELNISGDFHPVTIAKLRSALSEHQIDAVVVNFNKDIRLGGLAAKLNGSARVVWSVGLDITKDNLTHRYLTPRLVDAIMVPSESLKRQITRHGYIDPDSVTVIPIGIDAVASVCNAEEATALRSRYLLPEGSIVGVTVARMVEQKGHRHMLNGMPDIVEKFPNFYWLLLGSGPLEPELRALAERLSVQQHVVFGGMLDSVESELAGCDMMIHPSIDEPFGIALLEGMRAGLPIVASDVGGIPEVVGDCAILVEPRKPDNLSIAVIDLLNSPERMTQLGSAGRKRFEREFTLGRMIDRIEAYFKSVVTVERHG